MKCDEVRERLADYADGRSGAWTQSRVRGHPEGCEDCAAALREEEELDRLLARWEDAEPSEGVWLRIRDEVETAFPPPTVPWWARLRSALVRWGLPYGLGAATAALLVLALGTSRTAETPGTPDGPGGDERVEWEAPADMLRPESPVLVRRDHRFYELLRRLPAEEIRELQLKGILNLEGEDVSPPPRGTAAGYRTH